MFYSLIVSLFLATISWNWCDCAPLQVVICSGNTNTSCVGDLVTYTCTVPAVAHTWSIPSLGFSDTITRTSPTFDDPASPFSIVITADGGGANPITTALSVTSFAGLNGANITCSDGNELITETQDTIAMVFGPPSAPTLTAVPSGTSMSITYTITSPVPQCVLNYTINTTGSDGELLDQITVLSEEVGTPIIGGTVDVCSTDLTITATPVTMEGNGPNSASIGFVAENTPSVSFRNADETDVIVSWQPVGRDGITVTIGWSDPDGLVCVNSVEATAAESVAMQRTVSLNCTYNGTSVIFCVTFTSPVGCPSSVANEILTPAVMCRSPSPDIGTVTPNISLENSCELDMIVSWQPVVGHGDLTVTIGWSSPNGMFCENSAEATAAELATMQRTVSLDCTYNRRSVVICVTFTSAMGSSMTLTPPVDVSADICPPPTSPDSTPFIVALAVSLPFAILVGILVGALAMWCWNKKSTVKTSADLTTVPPNPVYDEVSQDRGVNVQLTTNEAYGHVK